MVSAAKLRRAQEHAIASRPYADMLDRVLSNVAASGSKQRGCGRAALAGRCGKKSASQLIVVSSDTGLGGRLQCESVSHGPALHRRASAARICKSRRSAARGAIISGAETLQLSGEHVGIVDKPSYDEAAEIARQDD